MSTSTHSNNKTAQKSLSKANTSPLLLCQRSHLPHYYSASPLAKMKKRLLPVCRYEYSKYTLERTKQRIVHQRHTHGFRVCLWWTIRCFVLITRVREYSYRHTGSRPFSSSSSPNFKHLTKVKLKVYFIDSFFCNNWN